VSIDQWATRWKIPPQCLEELRQALYEPTVPTAAAPATVGSEAAVQQQIRLEAPRQGLRLWRNNNGACMDESGRLVRYGLANDSARMSERIKSSDLIGITPVTCECGRTYGVFTSIEVKRPGWVYRGTDREAAQLAWLNLVQSLGGLATFATSAACLTELQQRR